MGERCEHTPLSMAPGKQIEVLGIFSTGSACLDHVSSQIWRHAIDTEAHSGQRWNKKYGNVYKRTRGRKKGSGERSAQAVDLPGVQVKGTPFDSPETTRQAREMFLQSKKEYTRNME